MLQTIRCRQCVVVKVLSLAKTLARSECCPLPVSWWQKRYLTTLQDGYSYIHAGSPVPLLGTPLSRLVDEAADRYGSDRQAVVFCRQNVRRDFVQLRQDVDKVATGLLSLGLRKGDRVGIWGPNCYEWLLAQYATARAGLISVCINPAYQANELQYCLNKVEVSAVIAAESFKTQNYYEIISSVAPEIKDTKSHCIDSKTIPSLKYLILMSDKKYLGVLSFDDLLQAGGSTEEVLLSHLIHDVQPDDPIQIQFTSGTTGSPKGATLSHHNMVNNAYFVGMRLKYNEEPHTICTPVPLYHCVGCVLSACNVLVHGACAVFPTPSFEPEATIKAIQQEKCTSVYGTPTMFVDMRNHPSRSDYDFSSLKTGVMTGAPCPEELIRQTVEEMKIKDLLIVYGTTETSPVILACRIGDSIETRSTKVGYPLNNVEVKIVDVNHKIVPVGMPGELWARGFLTMLGYWNDEAKTKEVLTPTGWYRTGDVLILHEDGYGQIVGRMKDMIIRGGENIYPLEIEDFLHTHPDILDAHVFGVPDKRLGEEVCVWIRLKTSKKITEDEVRTFCKGKIAHFKIPKNIRFVDSYPMTVTGKVQKFAMREEMIKLLCLELND